MGIVALGEAALKSGEFRDLLESNNIELSASVEAHCRIVGQYKIKKVALLYFLTQARLCMIEHALMQGKADDREEDGEVLYA